MTIKVKATYDLLLAIGGTVEQAGKPIELPTKVVEGIMTGIFTLDEFMESPQKFAQKLGISDIKEKQTHE